VTTGENSSTKKRAGVRKNHTAMKSVRKGVTCTRYFSVAVLRKANSISSETGGNASHRDATLGNRFGAKKVANAKIWRTMMENPTCRKLNGKRLKYAKKLTFVQRDRENGMKVLVSVGSILMGLVV